MTIAFVHGVPETPALWGPLRSHLRRTDAVALRLPGFGCPRPEGFGATKEEYVAWLVGELEGLDVDGPVDLVGHDWGGALVVRVVSTRPELVRSWVTDTAGIADANFQWHEFAKVWQTPGTGERFFEQQLALPVEQQASVYEQFGIPHDHALAMAGWLDHTMVGCILALYRSATEVGKEWAPTSETCRRLGWWWCRHRTRSWRSRALGTPLAEPKQTWSTWLGWATGGCCRTPPRARPRSSGSGPRSHKRSRGQATHPPRVTWSFAGSTEAYPRDG